MASIRIRQTAAAAALALLAAAFVIAGAMRTKDRSDEMDITFFVGGDLARDGGLVTLILRPGTEPEDRGRNLEVSVTSRATVVELRLGSDEGYTYRFKALDGSSRAITTERFAVGSFRQGEGLKDAVVLDHHVESGTEWTLARSRAASSLISTTNLGSYPCMEHDGLLVCDASEVIARVATE
ncbi:MAG: hypothetical protein MUE98_15080 [Rhodobacteraceae bacterium]|jgi:hypothetical protein|nr:hypothetical protein [Paracoccaceae bacterium]